MLAAQWMGVPPWDLAQRPVAWLQMALVCREVVAYDPDAARGGGE